MKRSRGPAAARQALRQSRRWRVALLVALAVQLGVVTLLALPLGAQAQQGWGFWAMLLGPGLAAWFLAWVARQRGPAPCGYLLLSKAERWRRAAPLLLAGGGGLLVVLVIMGTTEAAVGWPWLLVPVLPAAVGVLVYCRRRVLLDDGARRADQ